MPLGLLGKKLGHARVYDSKGIITPVTVVLVGPNRVIQVKSIPAPKSGNAESTNFSAKTNESPTHEALSNTDSDLSEIFVTHPVLPDKIQMPSLSQPLQTVTKPAPKKNYHPPITRQKTKSK